MRTRQYDRVAMDALIARAERKGVAVDTVVEPEKPTPEVKELSPEEIKDKKKKRKAHNKKKKKKKKQDKKGKNEEQDSEEVPEDPEASFDTV